MWRQNLNFEIDFDFDFSCDPESILDLLGKQTSAPMTRTKREREQNEPQQETTHFGPLSVSRLSSKFIL
jgi:hypothetical protein